MNGLICQCCRKPMGNSLSSVPIFNGERKMNIHSKCQKGKCPECFYMLYVGKAGTCWKCRNKVKFGSQILKGSSE